MRYLFTAILALFLAGASVDDARKANEAYDNGNYTEAITLYKKAIDEDPKNAKLYFNLASAQAKAGKAQEAIRTFEQFKSMTPNPEQQSMANYNIGNILAKMKQWDKAVDYYKKSLRHLARDADAKHNYELAKKKEKEQQKKQQNQNSQNQNQNQQQKQKKNQQNKNQQQQQKQNRQNQQNQDQRNRNQQNQQNQQQRPNKISKEQAEKILKALEQKEKDLLKQFKKQKTESSKNTNEKDW